MGTIDRLLPAPRSVELDFVDLAAPPDPDGPVGFVMDARPLRCDLTALPQR